MVPCIGVHYNELMRVSMRSWLCFVVSYAAQGCVPPICVHGLLRGSCGLCSLVA